MPTRFRLRGAVLRGLAPDGGLYMPVEIARHTPEELEEFRLSPEYLTWNHLAAELTEGEGRAEELTGLESWFTLPGATLRPLPQWKMAIATYFGVLPVVMVLSLTIGPLIGSWGFFLSNVVFNACVVACLTWLVMPLITRALHDWLQPAEKENVTK